MSFLGDIGKAIIGQDSHTFGNGWATTGTNWYKDMVEWLDGTAAMRHQNQLMIDNWNMQNAYNTPIAQMQRFKDAGLNPNLIYSQSNMAGAIGTPTAPKSGAETIGRLVSMIMGYYQIANMIAQNKNLGKQNTLLSSQADLTSAQAERYRYETEWYKNRGLPPGAGVNNYERFWNWMIDLLRRGGGSGAGLDNRGVVPYVPLDMSGRRDNGSVRYSTMSGEYLPIRY